MDCCAQSACLRCPRHWGRWKAAEFPASFLLTRPSTPANWSCISLSNPRFSPLSETPGRALSPSRREVLPDLPPALRTNTHLCSHRLQDPGSNACTSQRLQLHQLGSQMPPSLDGAEEPSWASRSPARSRLVRCLDKGAAAAPPKSQSARERMAPWWRLPSLDSRLYIQRSHKHKLYLDLESSRILKPGCTLCGAQCELESSPETPRALQATAYAAAS